MSLNIELITEGFYQRKKIKRINEVLRECELPIYEFPSEPPEISTLPWMNCWPSDLDYLKFIAAELEKDPNWTPSEDFVSQKIPIDVKNKFISENKSHLICHSFSDGVYVPVSFQDKKLPDRFLLGLGSSINFRNELELIAERLELRLGNYAPDLELLFEERDRELRDDILGFEKMLLLFLYNIATASIKHNLIIQFS